MGAQKALPDNTFIATNSITAVRSLDAVGGLLGKPDYGLESMAAMRQGELRFCFTT